MSSTTKRLGGMTTTQRNINKLYGTNTRKAVSTQKAEKQFEEYAKEIFQNRVPTDLRIITKVEIKEPEKPVAPKDSIKEESKTVLLPYTQINMTSVDIHSNIDKKDDSNTMNANQSEATIGEHSENDGEKDNSKLHRHNKNLNQRIYITLTETPTNFMMFKPSTKYFTNKNSKLKLILDQEESEEKDKMTSFKNYLNKLKNPDSFSKKGAQTINSFKRTQLVTTSTLKEEEIEQTMNQEVSALNWNIIDSNKEEKNKKDDPNKLIQKKLHAKINRELKNKLSNSEYILPEDESYSMHKSQNISESFHITETKILGSVQGTLRRIKPHRTIKESEERTGNLERSRAAGQSSPTSSQLKVPSSLDVDGARIPKVKVRKALEDALPVSLNNPLKYVERLLSQNEFHFRQIAYKNYPINVDDLTYNKKETELNAFEQLALSKDEEQTLAEEMLNKEKELVNFKGTNPEIKFLFRFSGKRIIEGARYIVNCIDWNPLNKDLLAAAYGDPDIDSNKEGILCFWTLKNPLHPERVIKTPRGLTSCHFSRKNPYYIVAADYTGEIMVFDLRNKSDKPIADSMELKEKHTDIVWEVKWVERPNDKNEMIVSISSDGLVKEWSLKKGLEVTDLMKMKKNISFPDKTLSPFSKYDKNSKDTLVFREANGLSFDFPKNDTTVYYISLEECTIHRCRVSYKDQYTDTYYGHQGPVYKIRCNPYDPNVMISCSYDWTMKIWNMKSMYSVMTCHSNQLTHQINDVEWSPFTSTIFGCVADNGRIEIWDLSKQTIDPIIAYKPEDDKLNVSRKCLKFSNSCQVVATGDSDFDIEVFRLYNLDHVEVSDEDQKIRLQNVLNQNS